MSTAPKKYGPASRDRLGTQGTTPPKIKPVKPAGKQKTPQAAIEAKTRALPAAAGTHELTGFFHEDWESNTPTVLRPAVKADREIFLSNADWLCHQRLRVVIRAFTLSRFARASSVLKPCLNGWIELLVGGDLLVRRGGVPLAPLATNYFGDMLAMAKQNPELSGKPVPWAESQTRSALNRVLGTTWFSTPQPEIKAESRKVNLWLREIDETVFVPRSVPDPALKETDAIVQEWRIWRGHGWLATWLPETIPAFSLYVGRPLEPVPQEVQEHVVEDITAYLFQGIEERFKRVVNAAQVEHACSAPATPSAEKHIVPEYTSEVKKAVFGRLLQKPGSSDRQLGDWLDDTGDVELPPGWAKHGNRSFADAYADAEVRPKMESRFSEVRCDMRKAGFPVP